MEIFFRQGKRRQFKNSHITVTYWPSTKPSIKKCTCVNKRKKAKQLHPVEDIGISPWPVDVDEFGADSYAHRKQVMSNSYITRCHRRLESVRVPVAVGVSWGQDASVIISSQTEGFAVFGDPRLSSTARMRKKCYYSPKNFGSICSRLSPSPTHLSHTTNINPFE